MAWRLTATPPCLSAGDQSLPATPADQESWTSDHGCRPLTAARGLGVCSLAGLSPCPSQPSGADARFATPFPSAPISAAHCDQEHGLWAPGDLGSGRRGWPLTTTTVACVGHFPQARHPPVRPRRALGGVHRAGRSTCSVNSAPWALVPTRRSRECDHPKGCRAVAPADQDQRPGSTRAMARVWEGRVGGRLGTRGLWGPSAERRQQGSGPQRLTRRQQGNSSRVGRRTSAREA